MPATARHEDELRDAVAGIAMRVLGMRADDLDDRLTFKELGVDSIGAVEIVRDVNKYFELNLEAVVLYDHPTLDALATLVADRIAGRSLGAERDPSVAVEARVGGDAGRAEPVEPYAAPQRHRETSRGTTAIEPSQPASHPPAGVGVRDASATDIAVIGMAGRFPGAASVDALWENVAAGICSVTEVPAERWSCEGFYDPDPAAEGRSHCKWGGFLQNFDRFDPLFFKLSPLEAEQIEPQQRLLLETAWHAVEDAGYAPQGLRERTCGVFVGAGSGDYGLALQRAGIAMTPQAFVGTHASILPARIAYHLDLRGPTMAIDTACSSSLVAIHQACQSLRNGECDVALAGGVSIMATPAMYFPTSKAGMLSASGLCRSFDDTADGFVPGEGVAVLVLKPLEAAVRDRDAIHAVIKGSGVNQDGASNGITAPSAAAQRELIAGVYARYGIDPERIGYLEAHGTGTQLGDPIEVRALTDAFRCFTDREQFCAIGSVKTNVGHLLAAAGITGVIKGILALRERKRPATLHCTAENHHIDFGSSPFFVNRSLRDWPAIMDQPRQLAVSSFGFSGTNAHLVLEEPPTDGLRAPRPRRKRELIVLSAQTEASLRENVTRLREHMILRTSSAACALEEVAFTLQVGREAMSQRLAVVVDDTRDLVDRLDGWLERPHAAQGWYAGRVRRKRDEFDLALHEAQAELELDFVAREWVRGARVPWNRLHAGQQLARVHLPGYAFARERCWPTAETSSGVVSAVEVRASQETSTPDAAEPEVEVLCAASEWRDEAPGGAARPAARRRLVMIDECFAPELASLREALAPTEIDVLEGGGKTADERVERRVLHLIRLLRERVATRAGRGGGARDARALEVLVLVPTSVDYAEYAPLAAVLKTARLENPAVCGALIQSAEASVRCLSDEGRAAIGVIEVRYPLDGVRQVLRRREIQLPSLPSPIREGGVYWITGGLGGLARLVAERLLHAADVRLVLCGRRPLDAEGQRWLTDWRRRGAGVDYWSVDVAARSQVESAFRRIQAEHGRLDGVFHCAGVIRDAFILKKTPQEVSDVLTPKVRGAVLLDEVTWNTSLDFFALFSSASGSLGNLGQSDYAAANAFLDAFAERRNEHVRQGTRSGHTVAFGWPLWADGGMDVDPESRARMAELTGATPLPTSVGLRLLEAGLHGPHSRVLIAAGDASRLRASLLEAQQDRVRPLALLDASHEIDPTFRARALSKLKEQLSVALKVPEERIDADAPFEEYGIDSVMVVRLNARLEEAFGPLPKTLFFEYQSLDELAEYFLSAHPQLLAAWIGGRGLPAPVDSPTTGAKPRRDPLELAELFLAGELSDDELSQSI